VPAHESLSDGAAEAGFALIAVAITLTALSLMMAVVVAAARESVSAADAAVTTLRMSAALEAEFATITRDLTATGSVPSILSQPQTMILNQASVTASIRPETAKVDLNVAVPDLLLALLAARGVPQAAAKRYVAEILDWRDTDSEAGSGGAEAAEYLSAGKSYTPTNQGFSTVSELSLLLHGSRDLATCLDPDVTVYSAQASLDLGSASAKVRQAAELMGLAPSPRSVVAQSSIATGHAIESGAVFEISLTAKDDATGRSSSRQIIVRVTGNSAKPIMLLAHGTVPREEDAEAACARLGGLSVATR